ncbi:hypothetical protein, partial [Bacteroides fragilis]
REYFLGKGISAGWEGIIAIKASMGAGNFKKQGWEWKQEEFTVKDQRTVPLKTNLRKTNCVHWHCPPFCVARWRVPILF